MPLLMDAICWEDNLKEHSFEIPHSDVDADYARVAELLLDGGADCYSDLKPTYHSVFYTTDSRGEDAGPRREGGGWTYVCAAAHAGNDNLVRRLCDEKGLDVNEKDNSGNTPLHHALMKNLTPSGTPKQQLISTLVELGANPTLTNQRGQTPEQVSSHARDTGHLHAALAQTNQAPDHVRLRSSERPAP